MRSEEFFNILDDMDERLVLEIYEDVQRPQKLAAVPRSSKRLPKLILSGAACVAVIAAAAVLVRFALPERTSSLTPMSAVNSASDSGYNKTEVWFAMGHLHPVTNFIDNTLHYKLTPEESIIYGGGHDWSNEDYEIRAVADGTVIFAGKISDEYGSGVIISHNGIAYTAYGSLDPDSVTVFEGDIIREGDIFAKPKVFSCLSGGGLNSLEFMSSAGPITEEYFKESCEHGCNTIRYLKNRYNKILQECPGSDGINRITAHAGYKIRALEDANEVIYTGINSDSSGMAVVRYSESVFVVYKGLDTKFPDFTSGEFFPNRIEYGDTIGYVGDSGVAYWYVLDVHEFEAFAKENNIATHPLDIVSKHE